MRFRAVRGGVVTAEHVQGVVDGCRCEATEVCSEGLH